MLSFTGLLLDQIIKNLSNAAALDSKQKVKMMVYSAVSYVSHQQTKTPKLPFFQSIAY